MSTQTNPNWTLVALFSAATSFLYWLLSDLNYLLPNHTPNLSLAWAPLAGLSLLMYTYYNHHRSRRLLYLALFLIAVTLYAFWQSQSRSGINIEQYLVLATLHLPLFSWAVIGYALNHPSPNPQGILTFILKSYSVLITGGLFMGVVWLYTGITAGLFSAINTDIPESIARLLVAGGAGLIPLIAVLINYRLFAKPSDQTYPSGLDQLVTLIARFATPFTLLALLIYVIFIPFNFWSAFETRQLLVIYNLTLIALIVLITAATSLNLDIKPRLQKYLRLGLVCIAALAFLINFYAFSATLHRTVINGLTPNRFTVLGWDLLNAYTFIRYLLSVPKAKNWLASTHQVFSRAFVIYAFWALIILLFTPLLFR